MRPYILDFVIILFSFYEAFHSFLLQQGRWRGSTEDASISMSIYTNILEESILSGPHYFQIEIFL